MGELVKDGRILIPFGLGGEANPCKGGIRLTRERTQIQPCARTGGHRKDVGRGADAKKGAKKAICGERGTSLAAN